MSRSPDQSRRSPVPRAVVVLGLLVGWIAVGVLPWASVAGRDRRGWNLAELLLSLRLDDGSTRELLGYTWYGIPLLLAVATAVLAGSRSDGWLLVATGALAGWSAAWWIGANRSSVLQLSNAPAIVTAAAALTVAGAAWQWANAPGRRPRFSSDGSVRSDRRPR